MAESKSARTIAIEVLNRLDPARGFAGPMLNRMLGQTQQSQRATDIVMGTLRNRFAIDRVIETLSGRPMERISSKLPNVLRTAGYELIYRPETAVYSIVNEAVENTKAAGAKQAGFVNAVLRNIGRHIKNRQAEINSANIRRVIPQGIGAGCEFDIDVLPDKGTEPGEYFSSAFSLPGWLVEQWLAEWEEEETGLICAACNRRPSVYVKANKLRIDTAGLLEKFRQKEIDAEAVDDGEIIRVKNPGAIANLPGYEQGLFDVQDLTSWQIARGIKCGASDTVLDLCSAPGGKTIVTAESTGYKARIFATDADAKRLEKVRENIERLGITNVTVIEYSDVKKMAEEVGGFDCVVADVPCSNTGVLARRPEVRYRITQKAVAKLVTLQKELLSFAASLIKPGGTVFYSTCSIQTSENRQLAAEFLTGNPAFFLQSEMVTLPSAKMPDHDGGYLAILNSKAL